MYIIIYSLVVPTIKNNADNGVPGLNTTPAFAPKRLI